jgi:glycosyltransferase involved in cell wall biosynthesis
MDWAQACVAIIPCYNEAAAIAEVVGGARRHLPNVIVVDDGSTDATSENAYAAGAEVIRHETNLGKGAALRTGCRRARERGFAWALMLDGDGQHSPDDVPVFFDCATRTGAALVIGDRLSHAEGMPWLRRQTNRWMTRRLARLTGAAMADSQCGFRLVNLDALAQVELTTDHFEIESELLVAFVAAGRKIEFVPVHVIYKSHPSKIHPLVDTWRWLRWWMRQHRLK